MVASGALWFSGDCYSGDCLGSWFELERVGGLDIGYRMSDVGKSDPDWTQCPWNARALQVQQSAIECMMGKF